MRAWTAAFAGLLVAGPAAAACPAPRSLAEARAALAAAEAAARAGDKTFAEKVQELRAAAGCLSEPADPALASGLHRMSGLVAHRDGDLPATLGHFLAARRAEDGPGPLPGVDLSGAEVGEAWASLELGAARLEPVARPEGWALVLDGRPAEARARGLPALAQWAPVDSGGAISTIAVSAVLSSTDPLPPPPAARAAAPPAAAATAGPAPGGRRPALLWAGAGALVAAAGLYGGSFAAQGAFDALPAGADRAEAERLQGLTNGLTVGAGVGAAAGLGLGLSWALGGRG